MPESGVHINGYDSLHHFVLEKLAEIRGSTIQEIEQELHAQGGDMEIDSPEGVSIANGLEQHLNRSLVTMADLHPGNFTTFGRLSVYLDRSLQRSQRNVHNKKQ